MFIVKQFATHTKIIISNRLGKCKVAHSWSVMLTGLFTMYYNRQIADRVSIIAIVVDLAGRSLLQ